MVVILELEAVAWGAGGRPGNFNQAPARSTEDPKSELQGAAWNGRDEGTFLKLSGPGVKKG